MSLRRQARVKLFFYHFVYFDATVGAHHGACGTPDAGILMFGIGEVIASVVHLLGLEGEHAAGACYHAKVTPFASFSFNGYCTVNFCHVSKKIGFLFENQKLRKPPVENGFLHVGGNAWLCRLAFRITKLAFIFFFATFLKILYQIFLRECDSGLWCLQVIIFFCNFAPMRGGGDKPKFKHFPDKRSIT